MSNDIKRMLALCGMTREQVEHATRDMRPNYPLNPVDEDLQSFMEAWLRKWSSCHEDAMIHMTRADRPSLVEATRQSTCMDWADYTRDGVVHRFYYHVNQGE